MNIPQNNGENALHGGLKGLSKSLFTATVDDAKENTVHFGYTSPDGEDGYPGALTVNVTYSLDGEGGLCIEYKVRVYLYNIVPILQSKLGLPFKEEI